MRGALVGTSRSEVIDCTMLSDTGRCLKYRKGDDEDDVVDEYGDWADDRILDPLSAETLAEDDEAVDDDPLDEYDKEGAKLKAYEYEDLTLGVVDNLRRCWKSNIAQQVQVTNSSTPTTNFKARLLSYVRVLTISNHHACQCHLYGSDAAKLFTGLDTLRTAPEFVEETRLMPVCDGDGHLCPFFTNLAPRKLVIRNIDYSGAPLPPRREHEWKMPATLEEVVFFLPTNGWRYIDRTYMEGLVEFGTDLSRLGSVFGQAPAVKVVFHSDWEMWKQGHVKGKCHMDVDPEFVIYTVRQMAEFDHDTLKVYGLETVNWTQEGEIVDVFKCHLPQEHLDNTRLYQLVHDELRTGDLAFKLCEEAREELRASGWSLYGIPVGNGPCQLHELPNVIEHGTLKDYLADEGARRHEITAED